MATKLKKLQISNVDLVDAGANPDAHIKIAKNRDGDNAEKGFAKRLIGAIAKAFGLDNSGVESGNADDLIINEVTPVLCAFHDSVTGILSDSAKDAVAKANIIKQSLSEFTETFSMAADDWANGESAVVKSAAGTEYLLKMRKAIDAHLKKIGALVKELDDDDKPAAEGEGEESAAEPDPPAETEKEPAAKRQAEKGDITDMNFDVTKMTPEERATFEDLAKRYTVAAPEPEKKDETDVYKGLHPAVAAEIETLRKFREDAVDRELAEVAKKYALIRKPDELLPVLKSLKAAGGTAYTDMIGILDASLDAVEKSGVFGEIGKRGSSASGDAWAKIEAVAHEIQKAKPDMRWTDALDQACIQRPELVAEYEKSRI